MAGSHQRLRVLIANQRPDRLELLAQAITGLGHDVIAREIHVSEVAAVTARVRPDVAFVGLGESAEHALELISEIVAEAFCPVIALLEAFDGEWVNAAAARGVFAYIVDSRPEELQSAIDITLRRYVEYQQLQGAFEARDAEAVREQKRLQVRQRHVFELHDGLIQSLTVAQLALELHRPEEAREALAGAVASTRSIVTRAFEDFEREGLSFEELLRDKMPQ